MLVWPDQRVRSVHLCAEVERATGASGQASRGAESSEVVIGRVARPVMCDRTRGASGHVRSDASGHDGSLLDSDRTPGEERPVIR
jgi:hypothetical protein